MLVCVMLLLFFFFKQKTAYEMRISDWSSDVCSSDLQLPAVALTGCVVVVSPLIALMHDQLRGARAAGIRAASLTSVDADFAETRQAYRDGELDLLYIAPERATGEGFRRSEEHTSELQSLIRISYAVFGLKKKQH